MRHKILVEALRVRNEPIFELVQHFEIFGRFSAAKEARLQLQNLLNLLDMLLFVRRSSAETRFGKELLFMGKVEAGVGNKLIKNSFEVLAVTACHQPLVQIIDEDRHFLMVVIQHLYVHTHFICPDNKRHS